MPSSWTKVPKPAESSITTSGFSGGSPIGLLIALTESTSVAAGSSITSGWGNILKPTTASWVSVAKPTSSVWTMVAKPTT